MQTAREKRQALRRRILGYAVTVVTIIVVATILFFLMLGYRFNSQSGTILQGGLVQFMSRPSGAHITVGVAELARPTKTKITLNPGTYTVKMELDNYQPWQKDITVESGKVLWLNSARLVPYERQTSEVAALEQADDTLVRQSGKFLAILPDKSVAKLLLAPLNSNDEVELEEVSFTGDDLASAKKQRYRLLEWSNNDRHILLERSAKAKREIVLVDTRSPDRSIVVGAVGKALPVQAIFDSRSSRDIVVRYSDGSVRLVDGGNGEVSEAILKSVAYMETSQGLVVYATRANKNVTRTGYYILDANKNYMLGEYRTKQKTQISLRRYYSDYFIVTAIGKKLVVQTTRSLPATSEDLQSLQPVLEHKLSATPLAIGFQNSNKLVFASGTREVTVYDLEVRSLTKTSLLGRTKKSATKPVAWLDGQHFWDDASGHLRQYEYDGTNQSDIAPVAKGLSAAYSSDGKYLYSFGAKNNDIVLQRTQMIVD